MRFLAATGLIGYLGGTALAACNASCPKYTIDQCATDASNACLNPGSPIVRARQSHLLRRAACDTCPPTDCSADSKKCTPGGQLPPQLSPKKVNFACGKKDVSGQYFSTTSYTNCPTDPTKKCLIFKLSDPTLKVPQLEISFSPLTNSAPGRFTSSNKCSGDTCVVPIDDVLGKYGKSLNDLCSQPLYIGLHSGTAADTCWPVGGPIADGTNNWAMQYTLSFDCPTYPETCCCCPPPAPALPDKKCGGDTAYSSGLNTADLSSTTCVTNSWGYFQTYPAGFVNQLRPGSGVYTARMLAGMDKRDVGEAMVTKTTDTCFSVTLSPAAKIGFNGAHVHISCSDPKASLGNKCRTPGHYMFKAGCISAPGAYTGSNICVPAQCPNSYYFIIHADTYNVVSPDAGAAYESCVSQECGPQAA